MSHNQSNTMASSNYKPLSIVLLSLTALLVILELTFTIFSIPARPIEVTFDLQFTGTLVILFFAAPKLFIAVWKSDYKGMSKIYIVPAGVFGYVMIAKSLYFFASYGNDFQRVRIKLL